MMKHSQSRLHLNSRSSLLDWACNGEPMVWITGEQLRSAGIKLSGDSLFYLRDLIKQGNREFLESDFVWVLEEQLQGIDYPADAMLVERLEWGNLYGRLLSVTRGDQVIESTVEGNARL